MAIGPWLLFELLVELGDAIATLVYILIYLVLVVLPCWMGVKYRGRVLGHCAGMFAIFAWFALGVIGLGAAIGAAV